MTLPYPTLCHHYCSCTISIPIPYPTSAPPHHALTLPYHYLLYPFPTKTLPLSNPTSTVPLPYPVSTTAQYHTIPYPTLSLLYIPLRSSTLINFLAYRVFTHPFFIQLRIWNFNWVSSVLLRTVFSINWVKWKTIW